MTSPWPQAAGSWLLSRASRGLLLCVLASCSPLLPPGKYPAVELGATSFQLRVLDTRGGGTHGAAAAIDSAAEATLDVRFPSAAFTSRAEERLAQLRTSSGVPLMIQVNVKRAQMTLIQDVSGNLVRWEVQLGITVTTGSGAILGRGTTSGWRELSEGGATEAELREAFLSAAIGAFDEYFGSEQTLKSIKLELAAFLRSHPR